MIKSFFTGVALLIFSASFAQDYIVTIKSDTIKGNIRLLSYDLLDRIQVSDKKKKTVYTALQVRRVWMGKVEFAPVKYENAVRMMRVIRSGFLSLYGHRAQGQSDYDTQILQKLGGRTIEVPNMGYKRIVGDMVEECPSLSEQVKSGELDQDQLDFIVQTYNACIVAIKKQQNSATTTPTTDLIDKMKVKVDASDIENKSDVNDLLTSILDKVKKNETIPPYMKDALKDYLSSNEDFKADTDQLLKLLE